MIKLIFNKKRVKIQQNKKRKRRKLRIKKKILSKNKFNKKMKKLRMKIKKVNFEIKLDKDMISQILIMIIYMKKWNMKNHQKRVMKIKV